MNERMLRWLFMTCCALHVAMVWAVSSWGWGQVIEALAGQTAASWIQAVGSIGAILGAFAVVQFQVRSARVEDTRRRFEGELQKLNSIRQVLIWTENRTTGLDSSDVDDILYQVAYYLRWLGEVEGCLQALAMQTIDQITVWQSIVRAKSAVAAMTDLVRRISQLEHDARYKGETPGPIRDRLMRRLAEFKEDVREARRELDAHILQFEQRARSDF